MNRRTQTVFVGITCTIVVAAIVFYAELQGPSCGLLIPCIGGPSESLFLESYDLNSPTNVTLRIFNAGRQQVTLVSYFVKDFSGNQYNSTDWSGPTINPGTVLTTNVLIDGKAFLFQTSSIYAITVRTQRNYFTFQVNT